MVWFGWKDIPWRCFKEDIILTESILLKSPIILSTSSGKGVFEGLFQFQGKFSYILVQQVLTKLFRWQESPELILQNPNFDFFISWLVLDKYIFLGSLTYNPGFTITPSYVEYIIILKHCDCIRIEENIDTPPPPPLKPFFFGEVSIP